VFDEYFERLEIGRVLISRVEALYEMYTSLVPATRVPHIFLENSIGADGARQWGSMWVYGPEYAGELKNFRLETKFDGVALTSIERWECTTENFTIGQPATSESRFHLSWSLGDITGEMPSTGANCEQLASFFKDTILPLNS